MFLKLLQIHRISEWNSLDINIRNSSSINAFKKELLKFIKPEPNSTYNINDTKGLKLLTRLWLGLSHSGDHKFRHNFQECVSPMCYCVQDINTRTHFLLHCLNHHCAGENPLSQDKSSKEPSEDKVIQELKRFCYSVTIN